MPQRPEFTAVEPMAQTAPPWFRDLVWDSLLGGLCPLIPVPFVDDLALLWTRRRLVTRAAEHHQVTLAPGQARQISGAGRGFSCLGLLFSGLIYPFRKVLRKLLYFLSIKDAVDTFSLLFHQGYLLHKAIDHGALSAPGPPSHSELERTGHAVLGTLESIDTRPLGKMILGVFRSSRQLVRQTVHWISRRVFSRRSFAAAEELDARALSQSSPETGELMDRLLKVLWGEEAYRLRLSSLVREKLDHPMSRPTP